ncbi:hypothetical protein [Paenibacillus humicus]|uniref:hypothetical protein n=1 Tax=Paenibacillus humicus TaxID=412861 RepID=UPI000FD76CAD|nr:hypothetical protein [Paenibacillus humicus]
MDMQRKRKKRRRRSGKPRSWSLGKLALAAVMAAALVPAVTGYMHHRSLGADAGETAVAPRLEASKDSPQEAHPMDREPDSLDQAGTGLSIGQAPLPGDKNPASAAAGSGKSGSRTASPAPDTSPSPMAEPPRQGASAAEDKQPLPATSQPTGKWTDGDGEAAAAADEEVRAYENKLAALQKQCVSEAGSVLELAGAKSDAIRRGELDEEGAARAAGELNEKMNEAQSSCGTRFKGLIQEAEQASVPSGKRRQWEESYEASSKLLRASLTERLKGMKQAGG